MYPSSSVQADSHTYHFPNQLTDRCYKQARGDQVFYPETASISDQQNQLNDFSSAHHNNQFNALSCQMKMKKKSSEKPNHFDFSNGFTQQPSFCYNPAYNVSGHQNFVFGSTELQQPYQPCLPMHQPQTTIHHKKHSGLDEYSLYKSNLNKSLSLSSSKSSNSSAPYYWMVKHQKGLFNFV